MNSIGRAKEILTETEKFIRVHFEAEGSGHDWWHIHRVRNLALQLAASEGVDFFIIEMAALLHDLDDWKLGGNGLPERSIDWLKKMDLPAEPSHRIIQIITEVSFKGAEVETPVSTLESAIVQDADRLDAIGAVGIARTFAYGGNKGRLLFHPEIVPEQHTNFEDYKSTTAPTINHFYEKLLLLKDRMNTDAAKKMADSRHRFMELYLERFFDEWEGKI